MIKYPPPNSKHATRQHFVKDADDEEKRQRILSSKSGSLAAAQRCVHVLPRRASAGLSEVG